MLRIGLVGAVLCGGCGLVLDLAGEPDRKVTDGEAAPADGGSRDGSSSLDGSVADASAAVDARAGDADGSTGGGDGAVVRTDAGPCVDDGREEDDDMALAMGAGTVSGIVPGMVDLGEMTSCPGDDDLVYAYGDCCEYERGAVVTYDPAVGNVTLEVLNPDGSAWAGSAVVTSPGTLELLRRGEGGYFYVVVRNASGTPVPYSLTVYAPVYAP